MHGGSHGLLASSGPLLKLVIGVFVVGAAATRIAQREVASQRPRVAIAFISHAIPLVRARFVHQSWRSLGEHSMTQSSPFMTLTNAVLWSKVILTAAMLVLLYFRYRAAKTLGAAAPTYSLRAKLAIGLAVVFSFAAFHNLGTLRNGTFVHYGEMFHYYLGSKYFRELGYYELYNATLVADAEQDDTLASLPFYTDLRSYRNIHRDTALRDRERIRHLFSAERWNAFKSDISFFKKATGAPRSSDLMYLLMDHGYNASPVSTAVLGTLTNAVSVDHLRWLAAIDPLLVFLMIAAVFRSFGFEVGAVFAVYFFVNILSGHEYLSGSLLRYDWLLYIVLAVCLLEERRHASAAFFLTLSAMMRIFPGLLFYGVAVTTFRRWRATHTLDKHSARFIVTAGATALLLFVLPAISLGSVIRPWKDFYDKTSLHDSGVYVNHLGSRAVVLFEPSHLSLESFAAAYKSADIVRHWQDVKENEFRNKKPILLLASLLVLACVTVIIWKRDESESASVLWPIPLIYSASYLSTYYYAFLCLFVLLFFRRINTRRGFVPLCLLLILNLAGLLTDSFKPSPIVFFTLINLYLFIYMCSILGFELYANTIEPTPTHEAGRGAARQRRRQTRARRK
jgi:hypothetical protein